MNELKIIEWMSDHWISEELYEWMSDYMDEWVVIWTNELKYELIRGHWMNEWSLSKGSGLYRYMVIICMNEGLH